MIPSARSERLAKRPALVDRQARSAMPLVVYTLGGTAFVLGTSEFIVAGLLTDMAVDLGVSLAVAGLMVTVFAVGIILGAPVMALATVGLPRRTVLLFAVGVFGIGHIVAALSSSYALLLVARILTALATGAFWAVAAVVAAAAVPPGSAARATAVLMSGLTSATALGIPLGAALGHLMGWRGPFWVIAAASVLALLVLARTVPATAGTGAPSHGVGAELDSLRRRRLWLVYLTAVLMMGSSMAAYAFVAPFLTDNVGLVAGAVPLALLGHGLGAIAGSVLGGRYGDRQPGATLVASGAVLTAVMAFLTVADTQLVAVGLLVLLGLAGYTPSAVLVSQTVESAGPHKTLASALSATAFNTGIAGATWAASASLATPLGLSGPALVGSLMALASVVPATLLLIHDRAIVR